MATDSSAQRAGGATAGPDSGPSGSRRGARKPPPRRRRKARMVHRVVRHVEVWSVAKIATAFAICGYVIGMISGYLLWRAADRVGTIDGIEGFMEDSGGYDTFEIIGSVVFQSSAIGFAILWGLFVALAVLGAVLFNLLSDLTGGIRMTAIDEDLIVTPARRPRPRTDARTDARPEARPESRPESQPERPTATAPAEETTTSSPDPWKLPAPNQTWTAPKPVSDPEPTNGAAVVAEHDRRDDGSDSGPDDSSDDGLGDPESIGLGSGDRVV